MKKQGSLINIEIVKTKDEKKGGKDYSNARREIIANKVQKAITRRVESIRQKPLTLPLPLPFSIPAPPPEFSFSSEKTQNSKPINNKLIKIREQVKFKKR